MSDTLPTEAERKMMAEVGLTEQPLPVPNDSPSSHDIAIEEMRRRKESLRATSALPESIAGTAKPVTGLGDPGVFITVRVPLRAMGSSTWTDAVIALVQSVLAGGPPPQVVGPNVQFDPVKVPDLLPRGSWSVMSKGDQNVDESLSLSTVRKPEAGSQVTVFVDKLSEGSTLLALSEGNNGLFTVNEVTGESGDGKQGTVGHIDSDSVGRAHGGLPSSRGPFRDRTLAALDEGIGEMEKRRDYGLRKYNSLLQAGNGRDSVQDAVDETADLFVYLLTERTERKELAKAYEDVLQGEIEGGYEPVDPDSALGALYEAVGKYLGRI